MRIKQDLENSTTGLLERVVECRDQLRQAEERFRQRLDSLEQTVWHDPLTKFVARIVGDQLVVTERQPIKPMSDPRPGRAAEALKCRR